MEISTGKIKKKHFILIYGVDKCGKTTFAADAPKSIIVGPEAGSDHINTSRAKNIKTFADVMNAIKWLREEKHDFQSVGIDSLDWIEPLLWKELCELHKVESIEQVDSGYGRGYTLALNHWTKMIEALKDLRDSRNMNVIVIAHSEVKTINDPLQMLPYDKFQLKLNAKAGAKWREAVDAILFANFSDTVFKINKTDKKAKTTGEGTRMLFTVRHAAFDAGNRYGLPPELPLSYSAFAEAADKGAPDSIEIVQRDIADQLAILESKDKVTAEKMRAAVVAAGNSSEKLVVIRNYARTLTMGLE